MPDFDWRLFLIPLNMLVGVYLVVGCGVFFRKIGWFPKPAEQPLFKLTVYVLMPCLIFERILPADLTGDYQNLVIPPILGFAMSFIGVILGYSLGFLPRKWTGMRNAKMLGTFAACVCILNYGFVPIPMLDELFRQGCFAPDDGKTKAVLIIQNLGVELSIWTVVIIAMCGRFDRRSLLRAINPPTCAIVIAILLNQMGAYPFIPPFIMNAIKLLGDASLPTSMFVVGISVADSFVCARIIRQWQRVVRIAFWSCLIRLVILPAVFVAVAVFAPLTLEIKRVLVIHAAMSSAIFPMVLARHYDGDPDTALDTIVPNSLLALATLPIWVCIGLTLIGS
jgi:predicted permease